MMTTSTNIIFLKKYLKKKKFNTTVIMYINIKKKIKNKNDEKIDPLKVDKKVSSGGKMPYLIL